MLFKAKLLTVKTTSCNKCKLLIDLWVYMSSETFMVIITLIDKGNTFASSLKISTANFALLYQFLNVLRWKCCRLSWNPCRVCHVLNRSLTIDKWLVFLSWRMLPVCTNTTVTALVHCWICNSGCSVYFPSFPNMNEEQMDEKANGWSIYLSVHCLHDP